MPDAATERLEPSSSSLSSLSSSSSDEEDELEDEDLPSPSSSTSVSLSTTLMPISDSCASTSSICSEENSSLGRTAFNSSCVT